MLMVVGGTIVVCLMVVGGAMVVGGTMVVCLMVVGAIMVVHGCWWGNGC